MILYDPPEGWRYGFPKEYKPSTEDEPLEITLLRDGYPADMLGLAGYTRFLGSQAELDCMFKSRETDEIPQT